MLEFALAGGVRSTLMFRLMESFLTIFVAVLWHSAYDKVIHHWEVGNKAHWALGNLCFLFVFVTLVGWAIRRKRVLLACFCGCGAHFVGFAACHTAGHAHMIYFPEMNLSLYFLGVIVLAVTVVCAVMHGFRYILGYTKDEKYEDEIDDLENDVMALTISYCTTQIVKMYVVGEVTHIGGHEHKPEPEFLQLNGEEAEHHTFVQRLIMFGFAAVGVILALFVPEAKETRTWYGNKFLEITRGWLMMCGAWGFLYAAHWEFFEVVFTGTDEDQEILGTVLFALFTTTVALAVVQILSWCKVKAKSIIARTLPLAVGLGAAFAWEESFDDSLEVLQEKYQIVPGMDGVYLTLILAVLAPCSLMPMYVYHIKPRLEGE
jgi:hypothetical protein